MSTISVNLKRNWFGPDMALHQVRDNPHEFPDSYADKPKQREDETDEQFATRKDAPYNVLPTTAVVLKGEAVKPKPEPAAAEAKK